MEECLFSIKSHYDNVNAKLGIWCVLICGYGSYFQRHKGQFDLTLVILKVS